MPTKAVGRVKYNDLMQMLSELDIDGKDLWLIRNLYWDQTVAIRMGDQIRNCVYIKQCARKGTSCHQTCFPYVARRY